MRPTFPTIGALIGNREMIDSDQMRTMVMAGHSRLSKAADTISRDPPVRHAVIGHSNAIDWYLEGAYVALSQTSAFTFF